MMAPHPSFWPIVGLMFVAGLGIPILATWNGALGTQLGSASAATFVLFGVGFVASGLIVAATGFPPAAAFVTQRPYIYLAALFMLFYALSITWAGPRIGIGNAVFFVLLGQLVAAAAVDHFGLWGALPSPLTARRALGILVMALGVFLARKPV